MWKILYNFRVIYFNENGAPFIGEHTTNHLLNLRSDIRKNKQLLKNRITIKGNIIYFNITDCCSSFSYASYFSKEFFYQ